MADQPSLESIPGSFAGMKAQFRPDKAAGIDKTIQFNLSGREPGTWTAEVRNGTFDYREGAATNPDATVTIDSDDWLKILRGELNGPMAFMSGKLKVAGDVGVMLKFQDWFDRPS